MQNTSKTLDRAALLLIAFTSAFVLKPCNSEATHKSAPNITSPQKSSNGDVVSKFTSKAGESYTLLYQEKQGTIEIRHHGAHLLIQNVPKDYDPALIGEEMRIRFLPINLQPYLDEGDVLLITSARTTSGDGGGQCGSGAEVYLKVLNIRSKTPKILSSHLIESCQQGIELMSDGSDIQKLSAFSVKGGILELKYLSYKDRSGNISAQLSTDLRHLIVKSTVN